MGLSIPYEYWYFERGGSDDEGLEPIPTEPLLGDGGGGDVWPIVLAIAIGFMAGILVGIVYTVTFT